ncbi:SMU1112c/YaeR family gloxylase I-like metalloprotein [Anaerosinus massiliensis]|uniref:SMU1112c/YaeR family gloxylase I-like metalloprotein n=1 Tax=Massilibacillus massiliensis TaxID=1806837 RepID=UPI000A799E2A|nr:VOC family protein [Massilibacillus massiliensis]
MGIVLLNLQHMHHIAIIVSDYEKSKHFYVGLLGFKIIRENYRPDREDYKLDLKFGESELEIFCMKNPPKRPTPEACGLRHLAFKVECIEAVIAELNAKGIDTEPLRMDAFTQRKMTFFKDPDGLPLELHE